jgi:hypothetical protein
LTYEYEINIFKKWIRRKDVSPSRSGIQSHFGVGIYKSITAPFARIISWKTALIATPKKLKEEIRRPAKLHGANATM